MKVADFARHIGLSEDQYLKRSAAARTLDFIPEARPLFDAGELSLTHLSLIAAKITRANKKIVLDGIRGKSLREAKLFMSRVTPTGELLDQEEVCEVRLILTKSQIAMLERAREVLAAGGSVPTDGDIVAKALDDLLNKRDPIRMAERAASAQRRRESGSAAHESCGTATATSNKGSECAAPAQQKITTRYVPAAVRHQVWMRDNGQCTHRYPDGSRCGERMMLELDHRNLFCRGGDHSVENLELKCRQHHHFAAEQALGAGWFQARVRRETETP